MIFSSATFLFYFLPFVVLFHLILRKTSLRNIFLLTASLFFYAWGETYYVAIMILSIVLNFIIGLVIGYFTKNNAHLQVKISLGAGVFLNLLLLGYYKYFNFIFENLQLFNLFDNKIIEQIHLPIGISFFTFQSISYLIDIYRKEAEVQRNLLDLGLYISLFPQLIAGPIIRYHDIAAQIRLRSISIDNFNKGIYRFVIGLSKKLIIADPLSLIADDIFSLEPSTIPIEIAWIGIVCYSLQIYFDFSGYSDMAIGLGKMLGFDFLENFNYPYISRSIQEFWRRWHISLSNWFRDYLYIPLGGNRKGKLMTYLNLVIVFLVTGLWHGASWNFIIWGLFHGAFLIFERLGFNRILQRLPKPISISYVLFTVMVGWVFFKANDIGHSINYLKSMFGFYDGQDYKALIKLDNFAIFSIVIGIIFSTPILNTFEEFFQTILRKQSDYLKNILCIFRIFVINMGVLFLMLFCIMEVASSSYSPFIYFRF